MANFEVCFVTAFFRLHFSCAKQNIKEILFLPVLTQRMNVSFKFLPLYIILGSFQHTSRYLTETSFSETHLPRHVLRPSKLTVVTNSPLPLQRPVFSLWPAKPEALWANSQGYVLHLALASWMESQPKRPGKTSPDHSHSDGWTHAFCCGFNELLANSGHSEGQNTSAVLSEIVAFLVIPSKQNSHHSQLHSITQKYPHGLCLINRVNQIIKIMNTYVLPLLNSSNYLTAKLFTKWRWRKVKTFRNNSQANMGRNKVVGVRSDKLNYDCIL